MRATDDGHWMIVHPGELIATFLLPLPDPLPFQDGTTWPTYRPMQHATTDTLKPWLNELQLQALDGSAVMSCQELDPNDPGTDPVNWSNKYTLRTSIQLHQTFSDAGLRLGLEPAMRLAEVVSGPQISTVEKARALDEASVARSLESSGLRELGLGAVTVAECYIGLRIVGDLPALEDPLIHGIAPDPPFGPLETDRVYPDEPAIWQWRKFPPGTPPDIALVERRLRYALDIALAELRSIQRATHAVRRDPTMISTLERLPFVVPVVLRRAGEVGDESKPTSAVLLGTRPNVEPLLLPDPLDEEAMGALNHARHRVDGGAFTAHVDMHREARVALDRSGDLRLASLLFGISAEALLDELILHLMWEDGLTPEHVAQNWIDGLNTRIQHELPKRLGGPWDTTRRNPIGIWAQDVAAVRHRVAHAAYVPTDDEARRSMAGVDALVTHLCDRLAKPAVLKNYPRTALSLAGEPGLRRRQSYSNRIRTLQDDPSEVSWSETYSRWREAWLRLSQDRVGQPRTANFAGAWLLAVRHPDGSMHWIKHDRLQHLAIEVDVNETALDPSMIEQLHDLADVQHRRGYTDPLSTFVAQAVRATHRPGQLWVEEYHHVPLTEVMVDRSDYRQATNVGLTP